MGELFAEIPNLYGDHHKVPFLWDYLRMISLATESSHEMGALISSGLKAKFIESMAGRADRDPLVPADPTNAQNRRTSIILRSKISLHTAKSKPKPKNLDPIPPQSEISSATGLARGCASAERANIYNLCPCGRGWPALATPHSDPLPQGESGQLDLGPVLTKRHFLARMATCTNAVVGLARQGEVEGRRAQSRFSDC